MDCLRLAAALAVVGLLGLAGCTSPDEGPRFRLSGAFTADRTQADLDEFNAIVAPYSDDVALLESFPEQFVISGIMDGCEQLRATLDSKDYVGSVSTCVQETASGGDGDDAVSNG